jgi:uncharacterized protein YbbK (DUF523 family)
MIRVLVSACLLGEKVRYSGADAKSADSTLARWIREDRVVSFCPEVAGGLGVPRPPAEIRGAGGAAVIQGTARVMTITGSDVTEAFLLGGRLALDAAIDSNVRLAILKDGSPSCGSSVIYDGSFTGVQRAGQGVTTAMLEQAGVKVFSETQISQAVEYLDHLESEG